MSTIDEIAGSTFAGSGFHGRPRNHECTIRLDRFVMPSRGLVSAEPYKMPGEASLSTGEQL